MDGGSEVELELRGGGDERAHGHDCDSTTAIAQSVTDGIS